MSDWKSAIKALKKKIDGAGGKPHAAQQSSPRPAPTHAGKAKRSPVVARSQPAESQRRPENSNRAALSLVTPQRKPQAQKALVQSEPPKQPGVPERFVSESSGNLSRRAYFKHPDAWVAQGIHTQSPKHQKTGMAIDIVIGLDFGTSFTKAAVGLKDQVLVVDWRGISAAPDPYLLPSEYSILADGSCQIGQAPDVPADRVRQRLKHPLIDPAVSKASLANAAAFVALVLRYIRAWVFLHHSQKIGGATIRWMLNIGAPSNGLENERHQLAYLRMCSAAWWMSHSDSEISSSQATELLAAWTPGTVPTTLHSLDVLPEFVAQIAGYVQSAQRQRGLHVLVDVGGGTLDVVTFIVHQRDGEDVFPFLVPEIRALGTQMLHQNRLVEAPAHDQSRLPDELQPVLDSGEFAKSVGLPAEHVEQRDDVFWGEIRSTVHRVLGRTRQKRYRLSDAWTLGLPVFVTGGGGSIEGYRSSVRSGGRGWSPEMILMPLPMHSRLAEFSGEANDYQRVSVACGLAQDAFSLGKLIPAAQVEDDNIPVQIVANRPERDELYPK